MKRALFISKNLIGDGLYIQPSLALWAAEHPDWGIDLLTHDDHIACLYLGMGIPGLRVVFGRMLKEYDFEHEFNVNRAFTISQSAPLHIVEAYGKDLGVEVPANAKVQYTPPEGESLDRAVLLSMFSNSCASRDGKRPNKMLSWAHWLPILTYARQLATGCNGVLRVLGGPKDEAPLPIVEEEYLNGRPLELIARVMRDAQLLITIDNGMGHLAATQETPTILFYPACLAKSWILPSGNPNLYMVHMDPVVIPINDALNVVRQGVRKLWKP